MKNLFIAFVLVITSVRLGAQDDDMFTSKTTINGYGELHYNHSKPEGGDGMSKLDFHRFVIFIGHSFSEKWSFKSEVEIEHNFVKEGQGELELEQAFVEYHHSDAFGFQAGVILADAGFINMHHEPPLFLSVERPSYAANIIPTTWFGNGAAIYGNISGFDYRVAVMEGLDGSKFKASSGIRSGRQEGFKANADELLYNISVNYNAVNDLAVGGSFIMNNAVNGDETIGVNMYEVHAKYTGDNIFTVFEYGSIGFTDYEVETANGYYFDLGYNVASFWDGTCRLYPWFRLSDVNTAASFLADSELTEDQYHSNILMFGLTYYPLDNIVFKFDYSTVENVASNVKMNNINLGVGYNF